MRKPNDCELKLGSETWQLRFVTKGQLPKNWWGRCRPDKKLIEVRYDLSRKNVLDVLIHEMRHAQHPVMFEAETFIDETSTQLAEGIIKTGLLDGQ